MWFSLATTPEPTANRREKKNTLNCYFPMHHKHSGETTAAFADTLIPVPVP